MTKIILIALLLFQFVWDIALYALSARQKKKPLPASVADVYDAAEYSRFRAYEAERVRINIIERVFDSAVLLVLFGTNVFSAVYNALPGGVYLRSILLMLLYSACLAILTIPFSWVRAMVIEEKYGFNRTTGKTFVGDCIKNFLVEAVLDIGLVCLALVLYRAMGAAFFIVTYLVIAAFLIVFSMLSTSFQKLYNKFTPLEDGELRDILTKLFSDAGYQLSDIFVMDASTRTTKVNAFCSGLGKFKKIVLYDNLVNNYTTGEIAAVFAHELGHYKHHDTRKLTAYSLFMMAIVTALIAVFVLVPQISLDYGFAETSVVFAIIALMGVVLSPVMTILAIPSNAMARAFEYRADAVAKEAGYGAELVSSLKKLSKDNLGDLNPHPVIVALAHNHPTLAQRIDAVMGEGTR